MNKLKKRIYRAIDLLAYKVAIRFDRISKWAYWKLLNIEKKENTDRIVKRTRMYSIPVELMDKPILRAEESLGSAGHNLKPKEKNGNDNRIISHMNEAGSFGNNMGYEIVPETIAELFDAPVDMIRPQGNNHKSKERNSNDKEG